MATKDFYVFTVDQKCYEIKSFFFERNSTHISCEAYEILLQDNFYANPVATRFAMDHIFLAEIQDEICLINVENIIEVLFIEKFDEWVRQTVIQPFHN